MRLSLLPLPVAVLALIAAQASAQQAESKQTPKPTHTAAASPHPAASATLPVTSVSLYKNGVGFFEHTGNVTGNGAVTIDFTSAQLNDVLQSLTAIDLGGGRIAGAGYNSTTPLDQQLRTLPFTLSEDSSAADFYAAIRGARVSVTAPGGAITGRLLSIETHGSGTFNSDGENKTTSEHRYLTVVSDSGEVRTLELTSATSVRLLDPALQQSVGRYLQLVEANRSQGLRHLTLQDNGTGTREVRVSYISEVPVWKSTYRILFTPSNTGGTATLQGWSVVDNTTGADWVNVHLSLVAGAPQSFIQPLSQPIYSRRPEIPIATEAQLSPQTFDSSMEANANGLSGNVTDTTGAVIPNALVVATNQATGARVNGRTDSRGQFSIDAPPGRYNLQINSPGFQQMALNNAMTGSPVNATLNVGSASQTITVEASNADLQTLNRYAAPMAMAKLSSGVASGMSGGAAGGVIGGYTGGSIGGPMYQQMAANSLNVNSTTSAFDDYFAYKLDAPVTILKNQSALVPILQTKIPADNVTLVSVANDRVSQPLRALWLTNASNLTLDRGSFTVIESGNFAGEGLLDPVHANEKRLVSYAADQAIHVTTEGDKTTNHVTLIRGSKGVLNIHRADIHEVTVVVHNAAAEHRSVVSELPVVNGWTLDSSTSGNTDPKPVETTATVYRFRTEVDAGATVRLHIGASHSGFSTYYLTNTNDNTFQYLLTETHNNAALKAALQPILEARRKVAYAQDRVNETDAHITQLRSDEDRQRANITALAGADGSARQRFVNDLNKTEDAINASQAELALRQKALEDAKGDLANKIDAFTLDETVS
ncbi:protein of unknown function [Bryocella elongata]|uniref:Carboxypeptidase regulatory-like domain-containing protein n=1 Tax=Bryocella elongata TaxID=863522 RepID=A0A1H6B455_9BACT|nr:carboxypeptidase regulatory-like domain-containing protein [Bryocella elongata]SEG55631.1 protein of unknown function [Bryocella elongata]